MSDSRSKQTAQAPKSFRMNFLYGILMVAGMWFVLSRLLGSQLIPGPVTVVRVLFDLIRSGQLHLHALASLARLASGLFLALVIALPLGILAGTERRADSFISPLVYVLYPVPKIAFLPVFMVIFGLGDLSKVLLLFSVVVFQLIIAVRDSVRHIPLELHRAAKLLNMHGGSRFLRLYLPSALPALFSGLRISTGIGIAVLFLAENYATSYGMGYFIMNNWVMINYPRMFAGILALAVIAALFLKLIDIVEKFLCPWMEDSRIG